MILFIQMKYISNQKISILDIYIHNPIFLLFWKLFLFIIETIYLNYIL